MFLLNIVNLPFIVLVFGFIIYITRGENALTVPIEGKVVIPAVDRSPASFVLTLNGDEFRTISRFDGSFTFHDVPTGTTPYDNCQF